MKSFRVVVVYYYTEYYICVLEWFSALRTMPINAY